MNVKLNRLFGAILLAGCSASVVCSGAMAAPDDAGAVFAPMLIASVGPDVLAHATGNYGINIAAGAGNQQGNMMVVPQAANLASQSGETESGAAAATSVKSGRSPISVTTVQSTGAGAQGALMIPVRAAVASLDAGALAGSVGNIGINIAAGYGNIQQNTLISR